MIRNTAVTFNPVEKTPDDIAQMVTEKGDGFVVYEDGAGAVVGFAYYGQFRGGLGYRHTCEHTIIVAPEGQGAGVGCALMDAICQHAKTAGFHSIWAGVSAENDAGVAFHTRVGFQEVARLPQVGRKFDRWMDLILMRKML